MGNPDATGTRSVSDIEPACSSSTPLLVGVDWSPGSRHALEWTALIASRWGNPVTLVHAITPCQGLDYVNAPFDVTRYRDAVGRTIHEWTSMFDGFELESVVVEEDPARAILRVAADIEPALIVLGSHGESRFSSRLLGSVVAKVLHAGMHPVAVVPRSARVSSIEGELVVGVDGEPASLRALRWASRSGEILDLGVYLVCAYPSEPRAETPGLAESTAESPVGETLVALRQIADEVSAKSSTHITSDVLIGDPPPLLVETAGHNVALVLGSGGRASDTHPVPGSTCRYCATRSTVPVVIVP